MSRLVEVRLDRREGIATLVLNRPEKRNALSGAMVELLTRRLEEVGDDAAVKVIGLRGAGADFCAGADLVEVAATQSEGPEEGLEDATRLGSLLIDIRRRTQQPVVAVVHGRALGGGCGLATACDLVLAREDALFGYPEVHVGFVPALVMPFLKRKVGESRAFELLVRGRVVSAAEAADLGLVSHVLPVRGFEEQAHLHLRDLASLPSAAVALTKRLFYGQDGASLPDAVGRGAEVNALARLTRQCRAGVEAFLASRRRGGRP